MKQSVKRFTIYNHGNMLVTYVAKDCGKCGVIAAATGELLPYAKRGENIEIFYGFPFSYEVDEDVFDDWAQGD
jgi:hypothetical protein